MFTFLNIAMQSVWNGMNLATKKRRPFVLIYFTMTLWKQNHACLLSLTKPASVRRKTLLLTAGIHC